MAEFNQQPTMIQRPSKWDALTGLIDSIQGRRDKDREYGIKAAGNATKDMGYSAQQAAMKQFGVNLPDLPPEPEDPIESGKRSIVQAAVDRIKAGKGSPEDHAIVFNAKAVGNDAFRKGFGDYEVPGAPPGSYSQGTRQAVGIENKTVIAPEDAAKNDLAQRKLEETAKYHAALSAYHDALASGDQRKIAVAQQNADTAKSRMDAYSKYMGSLTTKTDQGILSDSERKARKLESDAQYLEMNAAKTGGGNKAATEAAASMRARAQTIRRVAGATQPPQGATPGIAPPAGPRHDWFDKAGNPISAPVAAPPNDDDEDDGG